MIYLLIAAICNGIVPVFIKIVDMSSTSSMFYRCFLGMIIFLPFLFIQKKNDAWVLSSPDFSLWPRGRSVFFPILVGFIYAIPSYTSGKSIMYVGVGLSTLLISTQVFYLALFGFFFRGEKLSLTFFACLVLAGLGVYLLTRANTALSLSPSYTEGVGFGLLSGLLYAAFLIFFKKRKKNANDNILSQVPFLILVSLSGAFFLFLICLWSGEFSLPKDSKEWSYLSLHALLAQVIALLFVGYGMQKVSYVWVGFSSLLQPIVTLLLGWFLFQETLSSIQIVGVVLILGGVIIPLVIKKAH